MYAVMIDIMVMLLLLLTIVFCWRLNSKIVELKSSRKDLLELIKTLDSAIFKTNTNITELKTMSQNSAVGLNTLVTKAKNNINDLNFINETADKLADRLEKNISDARYLSDQLQTQYQKFISPPQQTTNEQTPFELNKSTSSNPGVIHTGFSKAKEELISALRYVK